MAVAAVALSCEPQDPEEGGGGIVVAENSLSVNNNNVSYSEGSQYLLVTAVDEWTLTLDFGEVEEG